MDGNLAVEQPRQNTNKTCGNFTDEKDAQAWLVDFLGRCKDEKGGAFFRRVVEFAQGVPLYRHHRQSIDKERYACDVLALPNIRYSVIFGAMVFEVKKSCVEIGPGLSQLKDYMASVFDVSGIRVVPSFGFLFPCRKQMCATASWMQHQSIGSICQEEYNQRVKIYTGEERLLEFEPSGTLVFVTKSPRSGRGSGSR